MLSQAAIGSAGGSANYFAKDNYYSGEESAETSMWYGAGAQMLGLALGEGDKADEQKSAQAGQDAEAEDEAAPDAADETERAAGDTNPDNTDAGRGEPATKNGNDVDGVDPSAAGDTPVAADPEVPGGETHAKASQEVAGGPLASATANGLDTPAAALSGSGGKATTSVALDIAEDIDLSALPAFDTAPSDAGATATGEDAKGTFALSNSSGRVDTATFENILNGKLPDGTQVGEPGRRALGMDLTFSAPKSVSIVGLIGGDKRVLEANLCAVQSAMRFAEKHFAEGRIKENGSAVPVKTGNLVYALFAHDTSRALDPQGHVHAVVANMTLMPNGEWRSLYNGKLWQNNTVIGSVYNAALRENLEKLGYTAELTGKHGSFEIVGVPKEVRDAFSQRREAILEKAAALGIVSHAGMDKVTTNTRDPKLDSPDKASLLNSWKTRSAELGFDPQRVIDAARTSLTSDTSWISRSVKIAGDLVAGFHRAGAYLIEAKDPLLSNNAVSLGKTAGARTELAVAAGIRHLDQREAAFGVHALTKAALDRGLSGVTPEKVATRVTELIQQGQLVPGAQSKNNEVTMLATRGSLQTERAILTNIENGKGRAEPLVSGDYAGQVLRGIAGSTELNAGQLAAATSIIASPDRIIAVQGVAGAGKSTMLGVATRALEGYGKTVVGLAFQNKMVGDLAEGAGIKAQTLASFLMPYERMIAANDRAGLITARKAMRDTVVVVDEASMVSNRQMASLTHIANLLQIDKLVLVGDRQQLLSIDAGKSFALAQAGGAATTRMDQNLRQRTDEMRIVAGLANRGKAGEALEVLGNKVISTPDRIAEASARWLSLPAAERDSTMVLTSGRETRGNLNSAIQKGLISEGTLQGAGVKLTVIEQVDRTREDLRAAGNYEPGLSLSLWGDEKSLGLKRGEYKIAQRTKNGRVQLQRDGKQTIIDPAKLSPSRREDRMTMIATKQITLHEGDKIRWTANEKKRELHNSAIGRVVSIDAKGITIENADKSMVRLDAGDPMLRRLDLAYTLNMHMAQGVTTDKAIIVMGSGERFLASQRLFNVAVTRARDGITVITDDKTKLARQLDRTPGDNVSALETTGQLKIDRGPAPASTVPINLGPIPKEAFEDTPRAAGSNLLASAGTKPAPAQTALPPLPHPEKSKGLEL